MTRAAESWVAVHGGAGERGRSADAEEAEARRALGEALHAAMECILAGGSALDAVVEAVAILEDHPLFNAGRGSALTTEGSVEMDASVMDGATRSAGAVACVRRARNPVRAARAVLEQSPHVLLVGEGADAFASARGLAVADSSWLVVPAQRERLHRAAVRATSHGTVGAVARDARGHLAAGTSTGGVVGQLPGRVGDSPIAGAGTWADDATCAVSATGPGEALIRCAFAHEVDAAMRLAGLGLDAAVASAFERLRALDATGGCIALASAGPPVLRFTTGAMWRGALAAGGAPRIARLPDEG